MYRCRDGFKRVNGVWSKHALHTAHPKCSTGGYYAYANPACRTIILEYTRSPDTHRDGERESVRERAPQDHAGIAGASGAFAAVFGTQPAAPSAANSFSFPKNTETELAAVFGAHTAAPEVVVESAVAAVIDCCSSGTDDGLLPLPSSPVDGEAGSREEQSEMAQPAAGAFGGGGGGAFGGGGLSGQHRATAVGALATTGGFGGDCAASAAETSHEKFLRERGFGAPAAPAFGAAAAPAFGAATGGFGQPAAATGFGGFGVRIHVLVHTITYAFVPCVRSRGCVCVRVFTCMLFVSVRQ